MSAAFLCAVTVSDMWERISSSFLSQGGDLDCLVTHSHTSLFSQVSTHLHPSTFHCALPEGLIVSYGLLLGGGVRECQTGWAGFCWSRPLCPLSASVGALTAAANLSLFPRGLCERTEMWCGPLRHKLRWSLSALAVLYLPSMSPSPPTASPLFSLSRKTPGARRGVTAVSGMLGGHCSDFPGLYLHLRLSDAATVYHS